MSEHPDDGPELDVRRVFETLDRFGVEYLVIGGMATRFYGASRLTRDIDVLPSSEGENLARLASALGELGAFLRVGGLSDEEAKNLPVVIDAVALQRMEVSTWRTDAGDLDVLHSLRSADGRRRGFDELLPRATDTILGAVRVRLAALADIVEAKRFADRAKDREALPELDELLRSESPEWPAPGQASEPG